MKTPEPEVVDEIRAFINENWDFFARWDNGEIPPDQFEWAASRSCDDWVLVNDRMPNPLSTKSNFLEFFPSMRGRFADDPVSPRVDFLLVRELGPGVYIVTYRQHYDSSSGSTKSRLITAVLVREHGELRVQLVHE